MLRHFGIAHYFDPIQGTDDTPPKPDPYILEQVMRRCGWKPEETIYVGDHEMDFRCARNAGVSSCMVTFGALNRSGAERLQPEHVIDRFEEVLDII